MSIALQKKEIARFVLIVTCAAAVTCIGQPKARSLDSLVDALSIREQAGQMILVYHAPYSFLKQHGAGGVLIMQSMLRKPAELREDLDSIQKKLPIPLLVTIDQEGGGVNRLSPIRRWRVTPSARAMTLWSTDSITQYWSGAADELRGLGINVNLAPVLDPSVNCKGRHTYMSQQDRSFGDRVTQIAAPAAAFATAFTARGVQCVAKHFPGYDAETNSDHDLAHSAADSLWLDASVAVFGALRDSVAAVMMSSIVYEKVCDTPAVFCRAMVDWARRAMGDTLVVMTDDLWGTAVRAYALPGQPIAPVEYPDSAFARIIRLCVAAGNDMLMITFPRKVPQMLDVIEEMAKRDAAVRSHVRKAAWRVLYAKRAQGLL